MKLPNTPPNWNPKPISPEEDFELRATECMGRFTKYFKCEHEWEIKDQMLDDSGKSYAVWYECKKCKKTKHYE